MNNCMFSVQVVTKDHQVCRWEFPILGSFFVNSLENVSSVVAIMAGYGLD